MSLCLQRQSVYFYVDMKPYLPVEELDVNSGGTGLVGIGNNEPGIEIMREISARRARYRDSGKYFEMACGCCVVSVVFSSI